MNADETKPGQRRRRMVYSIIRIMFLVILLFFLCLLTSSISLIEIPIHFLIGWALHAWQNLPRLIPYWTSLLFPAGCLIVAGFLTHRFILWWIKSMKLSIQWKPVQTITSIALLLLVSGAAIAMSGITHQFAWLMSEPWTEDRGRRADLTDAVNKAGQLIMALLEYEVKHGRLPDSLSQLREDPDLLQRLFWVESGRNKPREPFVLLKAGQALPTKPDEPVLISPAIGSDGRFVVGFSDCSVRAITGPMLNRILDEKFTNQSPSAPATHD